jgi:hypothetical protein
MSWQVARRDPPLGKGRSGRGGPVGLLVCIGQVVGEPSCGGIPVDELVEGELAGQRTRPPDVAAELGLEPLPAQEELEREVRALNLQPNKGKESKTERVLTHLVGQKAATP